MTKQEFEKMSAMAVTEKEFEWINDMFFLTDNTVGEEDFCQQFARLNLINFVRATIQSFESSLHYEKEVEHLNAKLRMIKAMF
jgi:hypothetical protein